MSQMGFHMLLDDMARDHDLQTQEAVARVFGSRWFATKSRISHGGGKLFGAIGALY